MVASLFQGGWTARFGFFTFVILPHLNVWGKSYQLLTQLKVNAAVETFVGSYMQAFGLAYETAVNHLVTAAGMEPGTTLELLFISVPFFNVAFFGELAGAAVAGAQALWFIRGIHWILVNVTTLDLMPWASLVISTGFWMVLGRAYAGYWPVLEHLHLLAEVPRIVDLGREGVVPVGDAVNVSGNESVNGSVNGTANTTG